MTLGRLLAQVMIGLHRDERGGVYAFAAVIAVPLVGFIGLSADAGRAYLIKARLSASIDAAALAGGRDPWSGSYGDQIKKYFKTNFPQGYLGAIVSDPVFTRITTGEGIDIVKVNASATMKTSFMQLFGFDTITISADTEVMRKTVALDVVLAIDMSGSMGSYSGGKRKINAARDAAKQLVEILYGNQTSNPFLKIGLVPWNGNVNVWIDKTKWNNKLTQKKSVATFKHPVTGAWQSEVWTINNSPVLLLDKPSKNWKGCVYSRFTNDGNSSNDADDDLGYVDVMGWKGWEPRPEGKQCKNCTPCLSHGITPLNQSKSKINAAIDDLTSPTGNTNIPQGIGWAWRVLMNTAPFTEGTSDDPKVKQIRAIVLLTDGANCAAKGDGYKAVWGGCYSYSTDKMNDRALAVATKMKAKGILVYTIQFGFQDLMAANLLKQMASGPTSPYYHDAPDPDALSGVFRKIATSLADLRLSK